MQKVYLCLELQCKGKSRFIEDIKEIISKTGQHSGHDCQDLSEIQARL